MLQTHLDGAVQISYTNEDLFCCEPLGGANIVVIVMVTVQIY